MTPPLAALIGYPPNEQQLLTLLWDREPRSYAELQQHERFQGVTPGTFDKYIRRLNLNLQAKTKGALWLETGRTVIHGQWCRLAGRGTPFGTNLGSIQKAVGSDT